MSYNAVILKSYGEEVRQEEDAAGAINPGTFVILNASGQLAQSDGTHGPVHIVIEDQWQGKTIQDGYTANDRIHAFTMRAGDVALARAGSAKSAGDFLKVGASGNVVAEATGDGTLQATEDSFDDDDGQTWVPVMKL